MQVSEQFQIGKTIASTAKPRAGQEQYYRQHNIRRRRRNEMVYIRPIHESGKPDWQKKLYYDRNRLKTVFINGGANLQSKCAHA